MKSSSAGKQLGSVAQTVLARYRRLKCRISQSIPEFKPLAKKIDASDEGVIAAKM